MNVMYSIVGLSDGRSAFDISNNKISFKQYPSMSMAGFKFEPTIQLSILSQFRTQEVDKMRMFLGRMDILQLRLLSNNFDKRSQNIENEPSKLGA